MLPGVRRGFWLDPQMDAVACWPEQVRLSEDAKDVARLAHRQQALTQSRLVLAGESCCIIAQPLRAGLGTLVFILEAASSSASFQRLLGWACEWLEQLFDAPDGAGSEPGLLFDYLAHRDPEANVSPRQQLEQAGLFAQRHWGLDCHVITQDQCLALGGSAPLVLDEAEQVALLAVAAEEGQLIEYEGCASEPQTRGVAIGLGHGAGRVLVLFCRSGATSAEGDPAGALTDAERKQLQLLALLVRQGGTLVPSHAAPRPWWQKTPQRLALAALLLVAIGAIPLEYRLSTAATLEGEEQHAVVAPFDGFVGEVHFRAGDQVEQGAAIMQLDTRDLVLAAQKLEAEIDEFQQQYRKDLAGRELAGALVWRERLQQSQIQLQRVQEQVQRAVISAPFAGHLISGNLNYKLNAPVKQGDVLYEISSLQGYRILLEVAESDIRFLAPGQRGALQLRALPQQNIGIVVTRILPVPVRAQNLQSYLAEATLDADVDGLQPGMEGVAKVAVGKSPLAWITFHHLVDWLRVQWWLWTP
ncbi:efflux RND transporter periplasmic adaptor subunit [Marinobacterium rhizophilum]|uniref:Efflux RND transporter periplasmic adaptor subunit n=1 Tax=Marinobacterium rhizophilum TaxID=420402 RepID=A0ABY5HND6_9GAMM|nr:efflux RND transporter periplasmic adaptor subunit [Marinobacterium rhizophilum]UTW12752.1 efflux RND transporter periplasmic adaptor subunit [Marinobacterium rhizophilum]